MIFQRDCGVVLHPTSLPGPFGMGELGQDARRWIDLLAESGQTLWQTLPLGPTGYADSPYQCLSTFAGNPMLVSLEELRKDGWLGEQDFQDFSEFPSGPVNYGPVIVARTRLLRRAARRFLADPSGIDRDAYAEFQKLHTHWLDDFALFAALKEDLGGCSWVEWPQPLRDREPDALREISERLRASIDENKVLQFFFETHWLRLRQHANQRGIRLVGDLPIFVAQDSADVWAGRDLFHLDTTGKPTIVAGVPPDYFSETGQLWGNPLYRWEDHQRTEFAWWIARLRRVLDWVDIVRVDHFRGFAASWQVPAGEPTAMNGEWVPSPGQELLTAVRNALGEVPVIAEDLGVITPDVDALRDGFSLPGMRILQFAFGHDDRRESFEPRNYIPNCIAYSGTHDNDTVMGWWDSLHQPPAAGSTRTQDMIDEERGRAEGFFSGSDPVHWQFIRTLLESEAGGVVYPLQDILGLGSAARMNIPGTASGNWKWRFAWDDIPPDAVTRLAEMTATSRPRA